MSDPLGDALSEAPALADLIRTLLSAISTVSAGLRTLPVSSAGSANAFGDDQLNVDVAAESAIRAALASCPAVATASSEEDPVERRVHAAGRYTVAFDPLDGSSIIAPNWSVGTIIGIWDGTTALGANPAEGQVAAILGVYGPRTTAVVAVQTAAGSRTCFEVEDGQVVKETWLGGATARYFAPANLRAAADDERYMRLVQHFIGEKYTLRYSGGLVPDVVHALVKGHGVYVSPVTAQSKAKLRKLYELFPVAMVVESAGGKAVDPVTGKGILEVAAQHCDERGGIVCGTADDVDLASAMLMN